MLTLQQASIIVDKALEKGRELGFKPLTVAVLDAGGQLKALKREDGSSLLPQDKLQLITKSAVAACDSLDGVKDGVLEDPRRCKFDPATLVCRGTV